MLVEGLVRECDFNDVKYQGAVKVPGWWLRVQPGGGAQ